MGKYLDIVKRAEHQAGKPAEYPDGLFDATDVIAVRIYSSVLDDECWLILREGFEPDDGLVVYRADEFPLIIGKSPAQLRAIHEVKKTFGGGLIVQ